MASEQRQMHLVLDGPGFKRTQLPVREGITSFGRLPSNDVILLGDLVSRHHARIIYFDGKASLQDLGSHNGSWVNGERVSTRGLSEGDVVRIGNFSIAFQGGPVSEFIDEATADQHHTTPLPNLPVPTREPSARAPTGGGKVDRQRPEEHVPQTLPPGPRVKESRARSAAGPDDALPENLASRRLGQSKLSEEISEIKSGQLEAEGLAALHLLYKVTEALSSANEVTEFLDRVLEYTLDRLKAECGTFFRVVPGHDQPERAAERNREPGGELAPLSMSVVRWAISKAFTVYSRDIASDLRFRQGESVAMLPESARTLVCAPLASRGRVFGALYLSRSLDRPFSEGEVDAIESLSQLTAAGIEQIELRAKSLKDSLARETLARFHSPDVVERILSEAEFGHDPVLENREVTVCFCDIRGFTRFADEAQITDVSDFLNGYVEAMSSVVFLHKGTINKLLGDGIVALFGAPFSYGNDAERAVSSAIDMQLAFRRLLERFTPKDLRLRVGINTGPVLTGTIGSPRQMEYTVIGDTVNLAARIQAAAPPGCILISHTTRRAISDAFITRQLGVRQIRGQSEPLEIYEVTGRKGSEVDTAH